MANQPSPAAKAVLASPELIELILTHLPPADILTALQVSKHFRTMTQGTLEPMRKLFLKGELDNDVWLLDEDNLFLAFADYTLGDAPEHPHLHRHFGVNARFLASVPATSRAAKRHQGPIARVVQLNPWLLSPHRHEDVLWKSAGLRPQPSKTTRDSCQSLGLNSFMHDAPTDCPFSGLQREGLDRMIRKRRKADLSGVLENLPWPYSAFGGDAEAFETGKGGTVWADMLLTQPPVRAVTMQVIAHSDDAAISQNVGKPFVKVIAVDGGVRLGHLMAALTVDEKAVIADAQRVETLLFLHDVVEDPVQRASAREAEKKAKNERLARQSAAKREKASNRAPASEGSTTSTVAQESGARRPQPAW